MATAELKEKWKRIIAFLEIALKELPEQIRKETAQAEEWLEFNELGLAYGEILSIAIEYDFKNEIFDRNMALAAKEMNKEYKR
jgi:hypothetical protein